MIIIKSKICLCCEKIFFKKSNMSNKVWDDRNYCCKKCGKLKFPIKKYLQNKLSQILSRTITTSTGCMEWQGSLNKQNYGNIGVLKKTWLVHRIVWFLINGEIPNNTDVLHKCDNPKCINIEHLFLGTNQDNMDDMKSKNRSRKGYKLHNCIVADDKKALLLKKAREGILYKDIAKEFGICEQNANSIALANGIRRNSIKKKSVL